MVKSTRNSLKLFKSKSTATLPEYHELIQLLVLHKNVCDVKLLAHLPNDYYKLALYSLKDHLKFLTKLKEIK